MNVEKIVNQLTVKNRVEFKLYSLTYVIENKDNMTVIYATAYPKNIKQYKNIEDLINNFMIYNEPLLNHDNRIIIIGGSE